MSRDLLLVLAGGGLGVVGTLVGTLFAYWLNKKSQREQWAHDELVRKAEWEQAQRDQLLRPRSSADSEVMRRMLGQGGRLIESAKDWKPIALNYEIRTGCFLSGTLVSFVNGSAKPIETVTQGEEILAYDMETHSLSTDRVSEVVEDKVEEYIIVNQSLKITRSHYVFAEGAYVRAGELKIGARLLDSSWQSVEVTSMELVRAPVVVYNLSLSAGRGFFVHGHLVGSGDLMRRHVVLVGDYSSKLGD